MNAGDLAELHRRADRVRSQTRLSTVIGGDVKLRPVGKEWEGLCPFHSDKRVGAFMVNDAKGIFKCFSCGAGGDVFKYLELRKEMSFMQALRALEADAGIDFRNAKAKAEYDRHAERRAMADADDLEKRRRKAEGLWHFASKLEGSPAQLYLEGRGIDFLAIGRFPGAIRYKHDCWNSELHRPMPAMVTAMLSLAPIAGARRPTHHLATHRTYLEFVRGRWIKARVEKPKMVLGSFAGAHIPISKGAGPRGTLADVPAGTVPFVSEGIEDALTIAMAWPDARVLAAATLGNIGAMQLPTAVSELVIVGQHDKPGSAADASLEKQIALHQEAGRKVRCIWPDPLFKDFNDQLRGVRMEGV
jgi:hypothetical protein